METKEIDLYDRLNKFLLNDCEVVPTERIKGKFLYDSFIELNSDIKLDLKGFYDLMRTWIEKTVDKKVDEIKLSKTLYFQGLKINGKIDNSIQESNNKAKIRVKEYRSRKAEAEGRIIIPRRRRDNKIKQIYTINEPLGKDVIYWDQHKITIDNFAIWYQAFLKEKNIEDPAESMEILNFALNNFRHARDIRQKEFRSNDYNVLVNHINHQLLLLNDEVVDRTTINTAIGITNKSRDVVIEELKPEMSELAKEYLNKKKPISVKQWIQEKFPTDNHEKLKLREEAFDELLLNETIRRNRYI